MQFDKLFEYKTIS